MPWLHMIFDAWEDYKRTREREAAELAEREAAELAERAAAEAIALDVDAIDFADDDDEDDDHKKKKKHRKKDKK